MRTIALFGIIVLNYHGYLNFSGALSTTEPSVFERWWHPFNGALANPFPVGFVLVAGMGVSFMTSTVNTVNLMNDTRWRLARRGLFLFTLGYFVNWVWPGTILPYYGAFFLIASVIAYWSKQKLISLGIFSMAVAAVTQSWRFAQTFNGNYTTWLSPAEADSPRNLLIRISIDYTHPLFPWLAFFITGILLGRNYATFKIIRVRLLIISVCAVGISYLTNTMIRLIADSSSQSDQSLRKLASTRPFDRGVLYVASAIGVVVAVLVILDFLCERYKDSQIIETARITGQMTLTIYLAHIFIYNTVVNKLKLVTPTGLDTAMTMSVVVYVSAIIWANWWHNRFGRGPAERVYRNFGC
ncbi:hypothetical protein EMGBS4_20450 [Acidimicrobiaceae bacterium]|nr:hypothetical protein EMGBS4_20450 [Acidimicrobiaceae bacterium]